MDEIVKGLLGAARLGIIIGLSGATFALCVATVCRWLKWAPINITVNNYHTDGHSR